MSTDPHTHIIHDWEPTMDLRVRRGVRDEITAIEQRWVQREVGHMEGVLREEWRLVPVAPPQSRSHPSET